MSKLTFDIAGKTIVCDFGSNYLRKFYKQIAGVDIFEDVDKLMGADGTSTAAQLIHAGEMAEKALSVTYPTKPEPAESEVPVIEDWLLRLSIVDATKIIADIVKIIAPPQKEEEAPGEAKPQAEQS